MVRHHVPRRLVIILVILAGVIGLAVGRGWAALEEPGGPGSRPPATLAASTSTSSTTEPVTTTTTDPDPDAALRDRISPSVDYWETIHRCEQPDSWTAYGRFGNGLVGGGGLGISDGAWHAWGGDEFAPTAAQAAPLEQMVIASVGLQRVGPGAWSCRA